MSLIRRIDEKYLRNVVIYIAKPASEHPRANFYTIRTRKLTRRFDHYTRFIVHGSVHPRYIDSLSSILTIAFDEYRFDSVAFFQTRSCFEYAMLRISSFILGFPRSRVSLVTFNPRLVRPHASSYPNFFRDHAVSRVSSFSFPPFNTFASSRALSHPHSFFPFLSSPPFVVCSLSLDTG